MRRQPDRGNGPWDQERPPAARLAELNDARVRSQATGKHRAISTPTGEHRAIPKRPPGMPQHLDAPPETTLRAPRPERTPKKMPKKTRRPLIIVLGAIAAIFVIIISAIVILLVTASNQASEPAQVAAHFVSSLAAQKYDDAYNDLGPSVNLRGKPKLTDFQLQATGLDNTEGQITNYQENNGSSNLNSDNTWSFTYTITRAKMTYNLTITVKQLDPNDNNSWKIVSYATPQGPGL